MASKTKVSSKNKKTSSKAKKSKSTKASPPSRPDATGRIAAAGFVIVFLVLVAVSYFTNEGSFITFLSDLVKGLIGWGYYLLAPVLLLAAVILIKSPDKPVGFRLFCAFMLPILFSSIISISVYPAEKVTYAGQFINMFELGQHLECGGLISGFISVVFVKAFSEYGAYALFIIGFVFFLLKSLDSGLAKIAENMKAKAEMYNEYDGGYEYNDIAEIPEKKKQGKKPSADIRSSAFPVDIPLLEEDDDAVSLAAMPAKNVKKVKPEPKTPDVAKRVKANKETGHVDVKPVSVEEAAKLAGVTPVLKEEKKTGRTIEKISRSEIDAEADSINKQIVKSKDEAKDSYSFPPVNLLKTAPAFTSDSKDEILVNRSRLEKALHSFGINASIVGFINGPTVTRYDIELEQGVKLSRITNLAGDIALSLGVVNVRIAPIPDKISTVGIEVPNKIINTVFLRDVVDNERFRTAKSKLSFAVGKDIAGNCIIGNIAKLPHMLIAGTTGSGKSVCINSLIISLLFKSAPDEVKMIMIDPKMVELGVYNGIPHLYVPVVTDPKKAAGALQWSVVEMLKRYRLFSEIGVRDIESYNSHVSDSGEAAKLPRVVIVIDELADLMMAAAKEVEESICRIAQMGRAAGMHLIVATQRPSADVITGLMKANIPSRIAFAVSSALESRIILDQPGAEKLIGMGDMLFSPSGSGKPTRVQGSYVTDEEIESVIQFVKDESGPADISDELTEYMNKAFEKSEEQGKGKDVKSEGALEGYDEMLPQAVDCVIEMKSCSVSMLQRRVKLGYSRAARIVDQMEELGIVGPYEGAKPRSVLVDAVKWHQKKIELGIEADDGLELAQSISESADD